jgi:hypothetical protein
VLENSQYFRTSCSLDKGTHFQKIGLKAIDAAATTRKLLAAFVAQIELSNLLARLFWSKSTRPLLFPRKVVILIESIILVC